VKKGGAQKLTPLRVITDGEGIAPMQGLNLKALIKFVSQN